MKWTRDLTGRFRERPHYIEAELEAICEESITSFLTAHRGKVEFPVRTEDLTVLIEQHTDDLDSSCELDEGVEGLTDFFPKKRPKVKIASRLQEPRYENRLRTTLTHEFGHVRLHGFLFQLDDDLKRLFDGKPCDHRNQCHRDSIERSGTDWMEWQARFASGALLMPASELTRVVRSFVETHDLAFVDIGTNTDAGRALIANVVQNFQVSADAARVRLEQRKALVLNPVPSLFQS